MKKTQLFDLLGEIDNKFLDEAVGADSEKPLKINTSREPVRWYHIAAPIAACLVLGAGVFTVLRFRNLPATSQTGSTDSGSIINSEPVVVGPASAVKTDLEVCKQMILEKFPDISDFSTRIMDINFDGIDEAVVLPNGGDSCIHVFSKQSGEMTETGIINTAEHGNCLKDLSELKEYDPSVHLEAGDHYWYYHCKYVDQNMDCFIDSIARITYDGLSYGIDFPVAAYALSYSHNGYNIKDLTLKKDWEYYHDEFQMGIGFALGTEISRNEFASLWEKHIPYEELDPKFTAYLEEHDPYKEHADTYQFITEEKLHVMDSTSSVDMSRVLKRALIEGIHYGDRSYVYLTGENVFRLAEDGEDYIRMDKMSVIFNDYDTITAQVDLDLIDVDETDGSHGKIIARSTYKTTNDFMFELYRLDDVDIIAVGNSGYIRSDSNACNFVALTKAGKLILLKGIYQDDTVSARVDTSNKLTVSGNSLIDTERGVEFQFFPEMFEQYADPDAEHAHFKCLDYEAPAPTVKGGTAYNTLDDPSEFAKVPRMEGVHENEDGTQEDLDRWNSFISSVDPAVIHTAAWLDVPTHSLSDKDAGMLLDLLKTAKLTLGKHKDKPLPVGGSSRIIGCDSDGNVLFEASWNDHWLIVTFDDSGKSYNFDVTNSTKERLYDISSDIF